ncbi:hypothetical protein D0B54_07430 [Solimonas sp. K1W22B-7]|uniref:c-type cytochrome n=1 Tax=Solimonas sp. K1W22B-7 TaxID=2303331 RepID=UPI000E337E08|nr:hypothetical protein [Solimonas sp. K1W22B-7]AXQ28524.1 hypothetical protein D0B54_07430 [Solimonas sp. K1W22B-7]
MNMARVIALLFLLTSATGCGMYKGSSEVEGSAGVPSSSATSFSSDEAFFNARVKPNIPFCRTCHVPGGVADVDKGRLFMLSGNPAEDYAKFKSSWTALGKGVETNRILTKPSGQDPEPHSGGSPWLPTSQQYKDVKILLTCWNSPAECAALLANVGGGVIQETFPLLGNPGKHFFVNTLCDGKPDSTPINWRANDPRFLLTQDAGLIDSEEYAVHFNDPFEECRTEALFANQKRQNELRVAKGQKAIYGAKDYAKTCGEFRERVRKGGDWVSMTPTDTKPDGSHASGNFNNRNNSWKDWGLSERPDNFDEQWVERFGGALAPDPVFNKKGELIAGVYNPYPMPGEEEFLGKPYTVPNDGKFHVPGPGTFIKNFGGTGRLQLGTAQAKNVDGSFNGGSGGTCFGCHAGRIGQGEVTGRDGLGNQTKDRFGKNPYGGFMGLPNTNMDTAGSADLGPIAVGALGATRGTFNADIPVEIMVGIRDFDSLDAHKVLVIPNHSSFGDQRPPSWWWLHNKTRYLWFGGHSTDSSRGNMYFGSINGLSGDELKENEGVYFEDVHDWTLSTEAPDYPQGYCSGADGSAKPGDKTGCIDRKLAESGAILFHEKNLWAGDGNSDIPRPKGNGSCASCHGAYSPRYANDKRFLPDPRLVGMTGYTVPLEIINTDSAQTEGWIAPFRTHISTFWWAYPDAVEGYVAPEEKNLLQEIVDDYALTDGLTGENIADYINRNLNNMGLLQPVGNLVSTILSGVLGPVPSIPLGQIAGRKKGACSFEEKTIGYHTPPLHGVWANSPYFHNGSVPTIWEVLKPSDRRPIWRRQRTTTDVAFNGFEWRLDRGYDFKDIGWKAEALNCGDTPPGVPMILCAIDTDLRPELTWLTDLVQGELSWLTYTGTIVPGGDSGREDRMIFNTNKYAKKNRGHEWTKVLTDEERRAVIEYLKTL